MSNRSIGNMDIVVIHKGICIIPVSSFQYTFTTISRPELCLATTPKASAMGLPARSPVLGCLSYRVLDIPAALSEGRFQFRIPATATPSL